MKYLVCIFFLTAFIGFTQDEKKEQEAESEVDYSKGFERLKLLGMNDASKGEYVTLNLHQSGMNLNQSYWGGPISKQGNAWLIEENKKGKSKFVLDDGSFIEVYNQANYMQKQAKKEKVHFYQKSTKDIVGSWHKVKLDKELKKILKSLRKIKKVNIEFIGIQ